MMHPILAQALAPWAPPPAPTAAELVTRALIMGLTAPDAQRAQECADLAEHWAAGLTEAQVEACKAEAMEYSQTEAANTYCSIATTGDAP